MIQHLQMIKNKLYIATILTLLGLVIVNLINYATQLIVEDLNILFFVAICIEFVLIILFRTSMKPINNIPEIADNE